MTTLATSPRTLFRNAIVTAFAQRKGTDAMRHQDFQVSLYYLSEEQIRQPVTYCVVVTDELLTAQTTQRDDCAMTVLIVMYIKDDADPRGMLDAAIEDAYETVLSVQGALKEIVWKMKLEELTTDEGTTIAKPYAQAVQRWSAHHRRAAVAA